MFGGALRGPNRQQFRQFAAAHHVPAFERREVRPLQWFLRGRAELTVFDVGAHKGLWTRALLNVFGGRVARVFLFDPSPENYLELTDKHDSFAGLYGGESARLFVRRCAIGRASGSATFYTNADGSPLGSLYPHALPGWGEGLKSIRLSETFEVGVDTIDDVMEREGIIHVDVLKIDTEGHEMDVLIGAEEAVAAGKIDLIEFEFGGSQVESGHFFKAYWTHLTARGYELYLINENCGLTPVGRYAYRWERFDRSYQFVASRLPIQRAGSR